MVQELNHELQLSQNFFLDDNVNCDQQQQQQQQQHFIPKETIRRCLSHRKKRYSPTKAKSQNFLTNIPFNRLKRMDFDNASFINDCFTYILFNLNPFFLEQKFDNEYNRECVRMLWTYLVPNEFYIFICKHNNFNVLNKLSLKYQNASEIVNDFIVENNKHFPRLKEYFKRNAQVYQYIMLCFFHNISLGWMIMV